MIRTVLIGGYISVQGMFEKLTPEGNMIVRVGAQSFEGKPVSK